MCEAAKDRVRARQVFGFGPGDREATKRQPALPECRRDVVAMAVREGWHYRLLELPRRHGDQPRPLAVSSLPPRQPEALLEA